MDPKFLSLYQKAMKAARDIEDAMVEVDDGKLDTTERKVMEEIGTAAILIREATKELQRTKLIKPEEV